MQDEEQMKKLEQLAKEKGLELYKISSVTGEGIEKLIDHVSEVLKTLQKEELFEEEDSIESKTLFALSF